MKKMVSVFFVVCMYCLSFSAHAADRTYTGFYWPMKDFQYSSSGTWLGPGLGHAGPNGHIGVDMLASENTVVYAISNGIVYSISESGWGDGNVAVLIKHTLSDGRWFIALYGHVKNEGVPKINEEVYAGKTVVGKLGAYFTEPHLHFGIAIPEKIPGPKYGYTTNEDHNKFIDPVKFIQENTPGSVSGGQRAYRTVKWKNMFGKDVAVYWSPSNVSCDNAEEWVFRGVSTNNKGTICEVAYLEFETFSDWTYRLQDWYDTFFGDQQTFDSAQTCRTN